MQDYAWNFWKRMVESVSVLDAESPNLTSCLWIMPGMMVQNIEDLRRAGAELQRTAPYAPKDGLKTDTDSSASTVI